MNFLYKRAFLTLIFLPLVSCSTLSNYQQPVSQFSQGTSNIKNALNSISAQRNTAVINNLALSLQQKKVNKDKTVSSVALELPSSCDTTPSDCVWKIDYIDGQKADANVKNHEAKALTFVTALDAYGQGLVDITNAQDIAQLQSAVAKAGGALANVAAIATPVAPPVYPIVKTITTGFAWLFGEIADQERIDTLKDIVEKAEPVIQKAVPALKSSAKRLQTELLEQQKPLINREMAEVVKLNVTNGNWSDSKTASQTVINDAILYYQTANNSMDSAIDKMKQAHTSLLDSLKDPDTNFDDAVKQISSFAAEAATLIQTEKGK